MLRARPPSRVFSYRYADVAPMSVDIGIPRDIGADVEEPTSAPKTRKIARQALFEGG
jgi:hypothetical protein